MNRVLPPAYRRLWRSVAIGNLADGVLRAALPLLALRYTDAPVTIATVTTVGSLPWLLVLLVGVVVDRSDRRRLLAVSGLARGGLFLVVAAMLLAGVGAGSGLVVIFAAALAMGVGETYAETSAGALIPSLVSVDQLPRANGRLHAVQLIANEFAGPSLAGVVVTVSVGVALGLPAAGYLAAGLLALRLPRSAPRRASERRPWWDELREGASFVVRERSLRRLVGVTGAWNVASGMAFSVLVLFAVAPGPMGLTEPQYGLLLAATGVGGLLGSLATDRLVRWLSLRWLVTAGLATGAVSLAAPAVTAEVYVVAGALATGGFAAVAAGVAIVSMRQRLTPDGMLGRVNAAFWTASAGLYPLGALLGGVVADGFGLRAAFAGAGLVAVAGLTAAVGIPPTTDRPRRDAVA